MGALPVILDVDPGVDDALALMLVLASPEVELVGVSTVSGNVPVEVGTRNALRLLNFLDRGDIPVFKGAEKPLTADPCYASEVHGPEGLGEAVLPETKGHPRGDGVSFLVEALDSSPGEVTLVATGPLTNLALANRKRPGILARAKEVIVMGGAIGAPGNVTPTAEFNFYVDPHAAQEVIASVASISLVTLDTTRQVALREDVIRDRILPLGTGKAEFVKMATRTAIDFGKRLTGESGIYLHDPLAVGLALAPSFFGLAPLFVDVETEGGMTRGQLVTDRRPFRDEVSREGHRVECVAEVDSEGFLEFFLSRVLEA